MFIAFIGGVIGLIMGAVLSYVIAIVIQKLGYDWNFILTFGSVSISIIFAVSIGLFFGLYPAYKASKLNPIEALRYE